MEGLTVDTSNVHAILVNFIHTVVTVYNTIAHPHDVYRAVSTHVDDVTIWWVSHYLAGVIPEQVSIMVLKIVSIYVNTNKYMRKLLRYLQCIYK